MRFWKNCLVTMATIYPSVVWAEQSIEGYATYQDINNNMGPAQSVGLRYISPQLGSAKIIAGLTTKQWRLQGNRLSGTSADAALLYDLSPTFFGSTQLQASDHSPLFPHYMAYQELGYKLGTARQFALNAGVGHYKFTSGEHSDFFKVGPTYWFNGGNAGYRFTKYSGSDNYNHAAFAEYGITDDLTVLLSAARGKGAYLVSMAAVPTLTALVQSETLQLQAIYRISKNLGTKASIGTTKVGDRSTGSNVYTSTDFGVGLIVNW
jgi:YaiO family outer membrane protein